MNKAVLHFKKKYYPLLPSFITHGFSQRKPVFIFSSRRSGSTALANALADILKYRYVDQPFDITPESVYKEVILQYLPNYYLSQLTSTQEVNKEVIIRYLIKILHGGVKELNQTANWPFKGTLFKICNALPFIEIIKKEFDANVIYLLRHPVSQALSVQNNQWIITTKAYLEDESFAKRYLSHMQYHEAVKIDKGEDDLLRYVLNWILENIAPLRSQEGFVKLYFEDIIALPDGAGTFLEDLLTPASRKDLGQKLRARSGSTIYSSSEHQQLLETDRNSLLSSWRDKVPKTSLQKIQELLKVFQIHEYHVDENMPIKNNEIPIH